MSSTDATPQRERAALRGRVICVPLDMLSTVREGDVMTNRWWAVVDGGALFFQGNRSRGWTPQCNGDERAARHIVGRLYPEATVEHVAAAYVGRWNEEWGHMLADDLLDAAQPLVASQSEGGT